MTTYDTMITVVVLLGGFGIGAVIGEGIGSDRAKEEAIDHKAAEWRCDPKTGERTFVWLTGDKTRAENSNP